MAKAKTQHQSLRTTFGSLNRILGLRAKHKLALAAVGSLVIGTVNSLAIALVLPLVDLATNSGTKSTAVRVAGDVLGGSNPDQLKLRLSIALIALFLLKDIGSVSFSWWSSTFINTERVQMSARILERYLTTSFTEMSRRSAAELMRTMDASVLQVFNYTINGLINFTSSAFSVITVLITLFFLSPLPTVALVAYFSVVAWLYLKLVRQRSTRAGQRLSDSSRQGWRTAFAALGAMKEVNLRGSHRHFVDGFRDAQLEGAYAGRTATMLNLLPNYFLEVCFIIAVGLVVGLSSEPAHGSSSALAQVALFVAAGFRVLPSVTMLLSSVSSIRIGADAVDVVSDELVSLGVTGADLMAPMPDVTSGVESEGPDWRSITIEDVSFAYPGTTHRVLDGINLQLPRGTSLALVGPSGAGKTTLVDVILGLHTPQTGRMTVDGVDVAARRTWWRGIVGYVPQDIYILDGTLAENVAFDVPRSAIGAERLAAALKGAQLESVVGELPEGVDTWLGERGVRLSGGQRQRVGIARALYREPQILVLDEATAALDNETEHRVAATIRDLTGDMTVIVVAHRLSTVRTADQVAFVNFGKIEALGTFDAVEATNDEFARLVELGTL